MQWLKSLGTLNVLALQAKTDEELLCVCLAIISLSFCLRIGEATSTNSRGPSRTTTSRVCTCGFPDRQVSTYLGSCGSPCSGTQWSPLSGEADAPSIGHAAFTM